MSKQIKNGVCIYGDKEVEFNYVTELSTRQKMVFVNELSDLVMFGENYNSFAEDVMFKFMIIKVFTDIDTSFIEERVGLDKIDAIDDIVFNTNVLDIIVDNINCDLIKELHESFELNIEYKTGIHRSEFDSAISSLMSTIENKILNIDTDEMFDLARMLGGMSNELTPERMLEAFANTDIYKNNRNNIS